MKYDKLWVYIKNEDVSKLTEVYVRRLDNEKSN